ncbi:MAG: peptidase M23 [Alphaproteobacteria bacterium]|nr:MAG: peptidase M23 [Alphaproteobacteria bacterium]
MTQFQFQVLDAAVDEGGLGLASDRLSDAGLRAAHSLPMARQTSISARLFLIVLAVAAATGLLAGPATARDTQAQLEQKRAALDQAEHRAGVETETLQALSAKVDALTAKVAEIRTREAEVQAELDEVQARLETARSELKIARERLQRAVGQLKEQLVSIYKADGPDMLAVILNSDGYDDMLSRAEYLGSIQTQGESIAARVRDLRDQKLATVESIRSAKAEIAAKQAELEQARIALESEETRLEAARARQQQALAETKTHVEELEGEVGDLEEKVQAEIRAAQAAAAAEATPDVAPSPPVAGPTQDESSSGLIWPVNGTVTSPFGARWGRMHEGIDIGAAEGTPIQAAKSGTVIMANYNGGYGNYTCIDHGGGFSTCYAHQSSISVSVGEQVNQGDVIGAVGNTGASMGAHLHFETRVNGTAQDPFGYL